MAMCEDCDVLSAHIAKLQKENSDLKYLLYWKDRNTDKLRSSMLRSNVWIHELQCKCQYCVMAGYWDGDIPDDMSTTCRFRPWLKTQIAKCGLTTSVATDALKVKHCSNEQGEVFDIDCHVVYPNRQAGDITFGAKIWQAELGSEELEKLDRLFELLDLCHAA